MANDSSEVWPLADFSPQRERPKKDAWKLPTALDPFFHMFKEHDCYTKCLEMWVKFCHNALKLISGRKHYKPFSSLIYNNQYDSGLLKNILGKSEWRDYRREAGWLNWRELWFQGRLGVGGRAGGPCHGQRSLVGSGTWDSKESDTTEWLTLSLSSRPQHQATLSKSLKLSASSAAVSARPSSVTSAVALI